MGNIFRRLALLGEVNDFLKNGIFQSGLQEKRGPVCDGQMESCESVRLIILAALTQMHTCSLTHFSSCLPFHGLSSI